MITLTYPYVTPTQTLTIRDPEFGDIKVVDTQLQLGRNRGGKVLPIKDADWPEFTIIKMKWVALSKDEADDFITFFKDGAAKEVGFLDWNTDQYRGLIKNPVTNVRQAGQDECTMEVELEFIGVIV